MHYYKTSRYKARTVNHFISGFGSINKSWVKSVRYNTRRHGYATLTGTIDGGFGSIAFPGVAF